MLSALSARIRACQDIRNKGAIIDILAQTTTCATTCVARTVTLDSFSPLGICMKFNDFALRPEILQAVADAGYTEPTPIQERAIPAILTGADLLGIAQTGTGKTAAFVLPMIERLASGQSKARMPRSLILSPTRELATQTAAYFETYGKHLNLSMALLIGGVGMDEQWRRLDRGVDVLIATPGRLIDQFERGKVLLGGVSILVIDEADRMLDMGFIPDVEKIVGLVSRRRQTLMFSATMPAEIRRLADAFLTNPREVQAAPPATAAAGIADHLMIVAPRQKFKALRRLIETQEVGKALVFCNRKREVASLRRQMERAGLNARDIHGDLDQAQRTKALDAFKAGEIDFLVATDVAARGLDIARLPCVINYDVPIHADDYIHRIGRTARAGREGRAYTLALPEEGRFVDAITRLTGKQMPRLEIGGMEQPDLEEEPQGRRRRGRSRKDAAPAAVAHEEAPRAEAPAADPEEGAPRETDREAGSDRPGRRGRSRRARGEQRAEQRSAAPATAAPTPQAPAPQAPAPSKPAETRRAPDRSPPAPGRSGRKERAPAPQPIVGMGEHVPLFMRRPVPNLRPIGKSGED
jgi:superfamily II DNA/RNA helicase